MTPEQQAELHAHRVRVAKRERDVDLILATMKQGEAKLATLKQQMDAVPNPPRALLDTVETLSAQLQTAGAHLTRAQRALADARRDLAQLERRFGLDKTDAPH